MYAGLSLVLALLVGVITVPAMAQSLGFGLGMQDVVVRAGGGAGITDIVSSPPAAAYSFRKLKSTYTGPAVKLRRTTGGTQDIGFVGSDFDTTAATTFCAATTCFVDTWYDQSGLGRHMVQATPANQPAYVGFCLGDKPCARMTAVTQGMASAGTLTPATGVVSFSAVADRVSGLGYCTWIRENTVANRFSGDAVVGQWRLDGGTGGSILAAAADNAWHSAQAVMNGAGSSLMVDGTTTAGTVTGNTAAGFVQITGDTASTCNWAESIVWDNYALTLAERTALTNNQRGYWTPLPLDNFATPAGAYSLRRLKSSYAGPALKLRRASDSTVQDINFLGFVPGLGAPLDVAAANTFCAATTCFLATWYDQSGTARDWVQPTVADQVQYIVDCGGGLPCLRTVGSKNTGAVGITPAGPQSLSAVGRVDSVLQPCSFIVAGTNGLSAGSNPPPQFGVSSSAGGYIFADAAIATWHAANGTINGAASILNIDGVETTGAVTVDTTAANLYGAWGQAGVNTCSQREAIWWQGYALTAPERAALQANQRSFWGF